MKAPRPGADSQMKAGGASALPATPQAKIPKCQPVGFPESWEDMP